MGYGEYLEWLSGEGLDTSYADNGTNPFHDSRETDDDCDVETEEESRPVQFEDNGE